MYESIRGQIDDRFDDIYEEVKRIADLVGSVECRPRTCARQINRENVPAETTKSYWKRVVAIPFLDVVSKEIESRFNEETRAHFELCVLIPEVIVTLEDSEFKSACNSLLGKWNHILPLEPSFLSEMARWQVKWKNADGKCCLDITATKLIEKHANERFFPNFRELLKILAILPIGSVESERSFS